MDNPALLHLRPYTAEDLSARSPDLPQVYEYVAPMPHPQRPQSPICPTTSDQPEGTIPAAFIAPGRTFVVLVDVSEEGKARDRERAKHLDIPTGREADMISLYGECCAQLPEMRALTEW